MEQWGESADPPAQSAGHKSPGEGLPPEELREPISSRQPCGQEPEMSSLALFSFLPPSFRTGRAQPGTEGVHQLSVLGREQSRRAATASVSCVSVLRLP